jgi:hypothetical protein
MIATIFREFTHFFGGRVLTGGIASDIFASVAHDDSRRDNPGGVCSFLRRVTVIVRHAGLRAGATGCGSRFDRPLSALINVHVTPHER